MDIVSEFHAKVSRQLRVKDLPKVSTWQLERDSTPRCFGQKASNLPISHHAPQETTLRWLEKQDKCHSAMESVLLSGSTTVAYSLLNSSSLSEDESQEHTAHPTHHLFQRKPCSPNSSAV